MHTTRDIAKGDKAIGPRGGEESMERDNRRKISVERSGGGT
jgi:hypothetical protein